jgi:O-antigen/teichoic acid export membrane protein
VSRRREPAPPPGRHLATGASLNVVAQLVTIGAAGVTSVAIARLLGPTGTGTLALAVTLVTLATTLFSLGLRAGIIYRVSRGSWASADAARSAELAALLLGGAGAVIGMGFYALTSDTVLAGVTPTMAAVTFAALPFALAWLFLAVVALSVERYETYGAILVAQPLAGLALSVGLAAAFGSLGAIVGLAVSHVVGAAVAALLVRRGAPHASGTPDSRRELRAAAAFGLKAWGSEVLQNLNYRLDLLILNAFAVRADVGVYSVALTITGFAWILPSALQTVLFPRTARLDNEGAPTSGGRSEVELAASRGTRQSVLLLLPTAVVLIVVLVAVVPLLYGPKFDRTVELGLILIPGTLALGMARVLVAVTSGRGRPIYSLYGRLIDMPVTGALYLLLIPAYGATGAAIGSTVSYALTGVISLFFFLRVVHLPLRELFVPTREDMREYGRAVAVVRRRLRPREAAR